MKNQYKSSGRVYYKGCFQSALSLISIIVKFINDTISFSKGKFIEKANEFLTWNNPLTGHVLNQ